MKTKACHFKCNSLLWRTTKITIKNGKNTANTTEKLIACTQERKNMNKYDDLDI